MMRNKNYPIDGEICEIIVFSEDIGEKQLLAAPSKLIETLETTIEGLPNERGIYKCKAMFWLHEGTFEGFPAPGETDCGWEIIAHEKILDIPKYE
jgi:hypothetical protein